MRTRGMWQAIVIVCMLGATGCSKTPATAPKTVVPPVVVSSEFQYSVGAFFADGGYSVKRLEYAGGPRPGATPGCWGRTPPPEHR